MFECIMVFVDIEYRRGGIDKRLTQGNDWDVIQLSYFCYTAIKYIISVTGIWYLFVFLIGY